MRRLMALCCFWMGRRYMGRRLLGGGLFIRGLRGVGGSLTSLLLRCRRWLLTLMRYKSSKISRKQIMVEANKRKKKNWKRSIRANTVASSLSSTTQRSSNESQCQAACIKKPTKITSKTAPRNTSWMESELKLEKPLSCHHSNMEAESKITGNKILI